MADSTEEIQIKVEPLSPNSFLHDHGDSMQQEKEPEATRSSHQQMEYSNAHQTDIDNSKSSSLYSKSFPDIPQSSPISTSYAYQSTSMPVFPSMPYSSAYSYLPDKTMAVEGATYTTANGDRTGVPSNYNLHDSVSNREFDDMDDARMGLIGKKSHLPKRYKCAMCAYRTRYKSDLNRHVRKHAIATFNCDICNMPFKTVGNVEFHKRKEHAHLLVPATKEVLKYSCKMCTYVTMYSSDLTRHIRKHYVAKFHCTLCNKPFMTSGSLVQHKRSVHDVQDVEVVMGLEGVESIKQTGEIIKSDDEFDEKGDVNGNIGHFDKEMNTHKESDYTKSRASECVSEKQQSNMSNIPDNRGVVSINLSQEEPKEINTENEISVLSNGEVYSYEEPELESTTFISNDSKAINDGSIENVPRMSNDATKYTCPHCDKSFGRRLVLDYHLKNIHKISPQGNGVYVEYPDDYDLALDISIQELENSTSDTPKQAAVNTKGPLRHKCPFCAYGTKYKSTFDRHVRKHELACHICTVCRMPFITFGHLQRHIRDNHPNHYQKISKKEITVEKQRCTYCDYEADTLQQLRMHCEVDHGQIILQEIQKTGGARRTASRSSHSDSVVTVPEMNKPESCNSGYLSLSESVTSTPNQSYNAVQKPINRLEEGVTVQPPSGRRYAKLISDFDDFASRPFACALCFYRTSDLSVLVKHTENHLTGCNPEQVPETARFSVCDVQNSQNVLKESPNKQPEIDMSQMKQILSQPVYTMQKGDTNRNRKYNPSMNFNQNNTKYQRLDDGSPNKLHIKAETCPVRPNAIPQSKSIFPASSKRAGLFQNRSKTTSSPRKDAAFVADRLIPTFSVHYRKDKTNMTRPYLCLLCRKRFRHLTLLKQHFKQIHSHTNVLNNQHFECQLCKQTFNTPMALQEHHELYH